MKVSVEEGNGTYCVVHYIVARRILGRVMQLNSDLTVSCFAGRLDSKAEGLAKSGAGYAPIRERLNARLRNPALQMTMLCAYWQQKATAGSQLAVGLMHRIR